MEDYSKCRAFAQSAFYRDFSAAGLHNVLNNGKPQPRSVHFFRVTLVYPVKPFKQAVNAVGRNSNARVSYAQHVIGKRNRNRAAVLVIL